MICIDKFEEIVLKAKCGEITEEEAIRLLESDFDEQMRQVQRKEIPCGLAMEEMNTSEDDIPEEELLRREMQNAVLTVINGLTGKQSRVVEMYYFDGLTVYEIAAHLGVTQPAVSDHLIAARKKIVKRYEKGLIKRLDSHLYSRGNDWLLRASSVYRRPHRQFLFPYELAKNANRLDEYIRSCFKDDKTVLPRQY